MGIKFNCPNGHKLNVKSFLAGRRGICPQCDARFRIPLESGGAVESIVKGDRGEDTQLTAAMQDEDAHGGIAAVGSAPQDFGSPLGSIIRATPTSGDTATTSSGIAAPLAGGPMASAAADPLSEDPQAVWYVRPRSGGQYGPAVGNILREWIGEGRVAGDSLVWREGWADWQQASSVFPQLAGLLSTPTPPFGGAPAAGSLPVAAVGGNAAVGSVGTAGAAIVAGPTLPNASLSPAMGTGSVGGQLSNKGMVRRRSGSFTAIVVMLLVFLAILLVGVFAWVLTRQPEAPSAYLPAKAQSVLWTNLPLFFT